ncbi:MAG: acyl-CoA thioesterase [Anaerolineae bacterium]
MTQPFKFSTPLKVRFNETDLQGHVNFIHHLAYFDVGSIEYLETIGYNYQALLADGVDFLYVESHCNYKSAVKWPELLHVHARIGHLGHRSLRFEFQIWAAADKRLVATGHIIAVTATRDGFIPCPIPDGLRQAVAAYEGNGDA